MNYFVNCQCGRRHEVAAYQAGTALACGCGRQVPVPLLSQLRRDAGQDAYVTNAAERIARLLASGEIPTRGRCLVCDRQTMLVDECTAVCEQSWQRVNRRLDRSTLFLAIITGPLFALLYFLSRGKQPEDDVEVLGHDVSVTLRYHWCEGCRERNSLRSLRELRQSLERLPEYAALFREYPDVRLHRVEQ